MIWIWILVGIAAVIALLIVIIAMQPAAFRITRKGLVAAPPGRVFEQVNDFHNWENWSPWAKLDPTSKTTYDGPPAGVGSSMAWDGNNKVGAGKMTITESRPAELVLINLEFLQPFKATNTAEFTFTPEGNQTEVSWSMSGNKNFMSKAFGLIMNMDKVIGKEFEKGLAQMKSVAESGK